ncbi:MAG: BMP family ABC transporter substrate-binding protein, partial [Oscillospiraceae bacterium]|nr:BMP family ABC transporter substrate-binding protein [Oscillospiraceae bacterium]
DIIDNGNWSKYSGQLSTLGLISEDPEANYVQIPMATTQFAETFTQDDYKAMVSGMYNGTITVSADVENAPATEIAVEYHPNIK